MAAKKDGGVTDVHQQVGGVDVVPKDWKQHLRVWKRVHDSLDSEGKRMMWAEAERMAEAADGFNELAQAIEGIEALLEERPDAVGDVTFPHEWWLKLVTAARGADSIAEEHRRSAHSDGSACEDGCTKGARGGGV